MPNEEWKFGQITLLTTKGPIKELAWIRGDFAVRQSVAEGWAEIIHLSSGTALPARFSDADAAKRAARDIQNLRSDWPVFAPRTMPLELRNAMKAVIDRHHGYLYASKELSRLTAPVYDAAMGLGGVRKH